MSGVDRGRGAGADCVDARCRGWAKSGGVDRRRGQQERRAPAARCLPADGSAVRPDEHAAHQGCRSDGRTAPGAGRRHPGNRHDRSAGRLRVNHQRPAPTPNWWAACVDRSCLSVRSSHAWGARGWRLPAATSRAAERWRFTCRPCGRWECGTSKGKATRSRRHTDCVPRPFIWKRPPSPARKPRSLPRRRRAAIPRSATPPASRTWSSCAISCARWACGSRAPERRRFASAVLPRWAARRTTCAATTSRPAVGR